MTARIHAGLLTLLVTLTGCTTPPAAPGPSAWDQARVTDLSQQLLAAANRWHLALLRQERGSGRLQRDAVAIQQQAAALSAHLEAGSAFSGTVGSYRALRELMDDANVGVDSSYLEQPGQDAWTKLSDSMRQITPYYDNRPFGQ